MSAQILTESHAGVAPTVDRPGDPEDYTGWFCVATDPFPCPADGCRFVARHMTAVHRIVVWPAKDDRMLLTFARDAKRLDRRPRVVEYAEAMGPAVAYDAWVRAGSPVHGRRDRPEGWHEGWRPL